MQRAREWASLQTSNGQTSGFPIEVESVEITRHKSVKMLRARNNSSRHHR